MARIRLKFVNTFTDKNGTARHYFRRRGCKNIALPGLPGSEVFMEAYALALAGEPAPKVGTGRPKIGTVAATVLAYLGSAAFADLAPETRRVRRGILEHFAEEHGDKRVALLQRSHVQAMLDTKRSRPGAARNLLAALSVLMNFAVENGVRDDNPTAGVKRPRLRAEGFKAWSEDEIAAYELRHPIGSQARLALGLLVFTGQRRADVVRMGRQHIRNGAIDVRQQKTGEVLSIPIHPELQAAIDAMPSQHLTFLTTCAGKPFSASAFSHWFQHRCDEAALPKGRTAHGLRKAAARRLADAGCSANVIAAITGHRTLAEVSRYTRSADQLRMAKKGIEAITGTASYKPSEPFVERSKK